MGLGVLAFGLGAGAGFLTKEPRLMLAQWMGDTQEVAWSGAAPAEAIAGVPGLPAENATTSPAAADFQTAAATPARELVEAERVVEPASAAASAAKPAAAKQPAAAPKAPAAAAPARVASAKATPAVSAPPPSGLAVQVGAFGERSAADALVSRLKGAGFSAYVAAPDDGSFRVRVGPFPDRARAEKVAAKLKQDQKLPTWILDASR